MPLGVELLADVVQHAGHVPVGVGIVGLLAEHAVECGESQFVFAQFRQHAAEARPRLEVIGVEFHGRVIPLPGGCEVARAIEQLGQHEDDLGRRTLGLEHGPQGLGGLGERARGLQISGEVEQVGDGSRITRIVSEGFVLGKECGDGHGRNTRLLRLGIGGRQAVRVKAQLELAAGAHQAIVVENAQPPSVGHDPLRHAGRLDGAARREPGELRVDVAQG